MALLESRTTGTCKFDRCDQMTQRTPDPGSFSLGLDGISLTEALDIDMNDEFHVSSILRQPPLFKTNLDGNFYNETDDPMFFRANNFYDWETELNGMWDQCIREPFSFTSANQPPLYIPNIAVSASQLQTASIQNLYPNDVDMTDMNQIAGHDNHGDDDLVRLGQQCMADDRYKCDGTRNTAHLHKTRPKKKLQKFVTAQLKPLTAWLHANMNSPYPDKAAKTQLATQSGMTSKQVGHWFTRARQKLKPSGDSIGAVLHRSSQQHESNSLLNIPDMRHNYTQKAMFELKAQTQKMILTRGEDSQPQHDYIIPKPRFNPRRTVSVPARTYQMVHPSKRRTHSLAKSYPDFHRSTTDLSPKRHQVNSASSFPGHIYRPSLEVNAASPRCGSEISLMNFEAVCVSIGHQQQFLLYKNLMSLGKRRFKVEQWLHSLPADLAVPDVPESVEGDYYGTNSIFESYIEPMKTNDKRLALSSIMPGYCWACGMCLQSKMEMVEHVERFPWHWYTRRVQHDPNSTPFLFDPRADDRFAQERCLKRNILEMEMEDALDSASVVESTAEPVAESIACSWTESRAGSSAWSRAGSGIRSRAESGVRSRAGSRAWSRAGSGVESRAGSSVGSWRSACSYTSLGSRRGRRLPFTESARRKGSQRNYDPKAIYVCTFCDKVFNRRYTWRRHEETVHVPLMAWICGSQDLYAGACPSCGTFMYSGEANLCPHRWEECWAKPVHDRTFYRQDSLHQHFRVMHGQNSSYMAADFFTIELEPDESVRTCPYCQLRFEHWRDRVDHVAQHFETGTLEENSFG